MAYADPKDPRLLASRRKWYGNNKAKQIKRQGKRKRELVAWVREQKVKCERCGFDNPVALQFHHLVPAEKEISIALAITKGWSRERIAKEIDKCEIVCANCHAIEHLG